ncbi:MAG: hypothetical protein ACYCW6_32300 [Candidatus Xenobia bacterium]
MVATFANIITGTLEVLGGLAVLVPSLSAVGALTLSGLMLGAVAVHLFILGDDPFPALFLLVASVGTLVAHRDQLLEYAESIRR